MSPLGSPIALSFKSQDTQVTSKQREQVETPPHRCLSPTGTDQVRRHLSRALSLFPWGDPDGTPSLLHPASVCTVGKPGLGHGAESTQVPQSRQWTGWLPGPLLQHHGHSGWAWCSISLCCPACWILPQCWLLGCPAPGGATMDLDLILCAGEATVLSPSPKAVPPSAGAPRELAFPSTSCPLGGPLQPGPQLYSPKPLCKEQG